MAIAPLDGEPWRRWLIEPDEIKAYFLSATQDIVTSTNSTFTVSPPGIVPHDYMDWRGKLVFPKVRFVVPPG